MVARLFWCGVVVAVAAWFGAGPVAIGCLVLFELTQHWGTNVPRKQRAAVQPDAAAFTVEHQRKMLRGEA
jgi:hypothetical protein